MKNKRGDITTQQIVLLIILIASFIVILFFIFQLNPGQTSAKDVCHNSVITRSSKVLPQGSTPLNCKTSYICITQDGTCEKVTSPEIVKVATKDAVYNELANEMYNCWWMFGEGKINYIGEDVFPQLYCSLCDQVSFDNSMNKIFPNGEIDKNDFYNYLANTNISNQQITYLDYLVGLKESQTIENKLKANKSEFGQINISLQYYIVMGIISKVSVGGWIGIGAGTVALGLLTFGVSIPITVIVAVAGGVGGHFIGIMVEGVGGQNYLSPTIVEANSDDFNKLKCSSIKTLA